MSAAPLRLWGDNYFIAKDKKWVAPRGGERPSTPRAYCMFILDPIYKVRGSAAAACPSRR